ncbi:MAG: UDP-N-acetylglucosamine 1-carboxyvinyltransferase, partial [bacterium]
MAKLHIQGGCHLSGELSVPGAKNAVLPILTATLLTDEECVITNVPNIGDIYVMCSLLRHLGLQVDFDKDARVVRVKKNNLLGQVDPTLALKLRASILLLGPLFSQLSSFTMPYPGGCILGRRPLDPHFKLIEAFGAEVLSYSDSFQISRRTELSGKRVFLPEASVTVTENALMLASTIDGETTICNAASEPHVENLAAMLIKMGATIQGAGTNTIIVQGKKKLSGCTIEIIPDQIEVGTWAIAAALTKGNIVVRDVILEHLDIILLKLAEAGIGYDLKKNGEKTDLHVDARDNKGFKATNLTTNLWPGFPTDLQAPYAVLMTQAKGVSLVHDWMYEGRLFYIDKLIRMGADITLCDPHRAIVYGPTPPQGKKLESPDLRAGMALVLAG